jgi:hypothetical protein
MVHPVNEYASRQQLIARLKVEAVFPSTFPSAIFISEQFRGIHLPDDP